MSNVTVNKNNRKGNLTATIVVLNQKQKENLNKKTKTK